MPIDEHNHGINAARLTKWLVLILAGILLTPAFMFFKMVEWLRHWEVIDDIAIFRLITAPLRAIARHLHITPDTFGLGVVDRALKRAEAAFDDMTTAMIDWAGYGGQRAYTLGVALGVSGVVVTITLFTGMGPVLLYALTPTTVSELTAFLTVTAVGFLVLYARLALKKLVTVGFKHTMELKQAVASHQEAKKDVDQVKKVLKVDKQQARGLLAGINRSLDPPAEPVRPLRLLLVFLLAIPLAAFYIPVKLVKMIRRGGFIKDHLGLKVVRPLVGHVTKELQRQLPVEKSPLTMFEQSYEFIEAYLMEWAGPGGKAAYKTGLALGILVIVAALTYVSGTGPLLLAALVPTSATAMTTMLAHVFSGVLVLYAGVAISQLMNAFVQHEVKQEISQRLASEQHDELLLDIPLVHEASIRSQAIKDHEGIQIQPTQVIKILADKQFSVEKPPGLNNRQEQ